MLCSTWHLRIQGELSCYVAHVNANARRTIMLSIAWHFRIPRRTIVLRST
jgi:hypothetical protein